MRSASASLRARLTWGAALFITIALIVACVVIAVVLHRFAQGQIDQRLDAQIDAVAAALELQPDGSIGMSRNVDAPPFDGLFSGWSWQVADTEPALRSRSLAGADLTLPPMRQNWPWDWFGKPKTAEAAGPRGAALHLRVQPRSVGSRSVTIIASAPREAIDGPLREALVPVAISLAVLGVGLFLGTLFQVRLGLRPLTRLRAALSEVRAGRLEHVPAEQPFEVRPLVVELNSLLDENAENLARARRHVANLAHGLKTPLATLALALAEEGRAPDDQLSSLIRLIDRRIRHHLGRARMAAGRPGRVQTVLAPHVADLLAALSKIHSEKNLSFETHIHPDLAVACDAQDLDEMLGNVLENACQWSRTRVRIGGERDGGFVRLTIGDDGPGLPPDMIPDVLQAGRRLDESAAGYGFGLTITRELVELYGGALVLDRSELGGLQAAFTLPCF